MMGFKRKIYDDLIEWKNKENHNPLIIKGCRQCGKTFAVLEFAKENYDNVVYLNFFENPNYNEIFKGALNIDYITKMLSTLIDPNIKFEAGKTVIIFDEIQECPDARTSLKFFKLDGRYDVLATGSLLGVSGYNKEARSIPVGYEEIIDMYPMDFEEFLWANNIDDDLIDILKNSFNKETPVPIALHNKMRELLLNYVVVGGMPSVVRAYINDNDMNEVLNLQRNIVSSYRDDMVKYYKNKCILECFNSIPTQLSKKNKKFQYSTIQRGARANKFASSIKWIEDAGIIARAYNLSITELPLDGNAINDVFKVYMVDTGLFISMLENGTQFDILTGNLGGYKGAIYENLIADIFTKMKRKLYYFRKDSGLEIDFVTRYKGKCTLVEVKATTGNTKSSRTILDNYNKYHVDFLIKLGDYNVGKEGNILTLPLYMAFLIKEY